METLIAELMISDMEKKMDISQYGNQKNVSIQHYLINMVHKILTAVDINTQRETFAVIATMIDWKQAFSRQCLKLGIKSFMENNLRNSLIPLLINYLQDRQVVVNIMAAGLFPELLTAEALKERQGQNSQMGTVGSAVTFFMFFSKCPIIIFLKH